MCLLIALAHTVLTLLHSVHQIGPQWQCKHVRRLHECAHSADRALDADGHDGAADACAVRGDGPTDRRPRELRQHVRSLTHSSSAALVLSAPPRQPIPAFPRACRAYAYLGSLPTHVSRVALVSRGRLQYSGVPQPRALRPWRAAAIDTSLTVGSARLRHSTKRR